MVTPKPQRQLATTGKYKFVIPEDFLYLDTVGP